MLALRFQITSPVHGQADASAAEREARRRETTQQYPRYQVEVTEAAILDLGFVKSGIISAYLMFNTIGLPPGVVIPAFNVFVFENFHGQWLLVRINGVRVGAQV